MEDLLNRTNEHYEEKGLALIQKIPTPITPVQIDKEHRHITLAYFDKISTVDYIGAVQGIPVCFDAFKLDADIQVNESTGKEDITLSGYDNEEKVEIGHYYGSIEEGTMRVVYNPVISHQLQFFSKTNAAITSQFFMDTLGAPTPIPAADQTWFLKECLNGLGVLGFFLFLVPFAGLLLETPFFASIIQPLQETPQAVAGKKNKLLSLGSKVLLAVIPGITVMPVFTGLVYGKIFTNAGQKVPGYLSL